MPAIDRAGAAILAAAVIACAGACSGCEEKTRPPVAAIGTPSDIPDQESWNAVITFTDSGRITGILRAGYIAKRADKRFTDLDSGIVVDFYNDRFEHTSRLTARSGRINDATNDFESRGNVVVSSDSGTVLKTEELFWDARREKVHTAAFVTIVSPREEISGTGFESDPDLVNYKLLGSVSGKAQSGGP